MNDEFWNEWDRCSGWLEAAVENDGGWTLESVLREVLDGRAQFFSAERCAVVTRVHTYPRSKRLHIWLAGGDMDALVGLLPTAEWYANEWDCDGIEVDGRAGWRRVLREHGYEPVRVTLRKDL